MNLARLNILLFVCFLCNCGENKGANPYPENGIRWISQSSGTTQQLRGVMTNDSQFIAVGDSGNLLSSYDGINWQKNIIGDAANLYAVAYGNGTYVTVGRNKYGDSGCIFSSSIVGNNWTKRAGFYGIGFEDVIWNGLIFVALASGVYGQIISSPDGIDWTSDTIMQGISLISVTWGKNIFVAVGSDTSIGGFIGNIAIFTSADGNIWKQQPQDLRGILTGVTWGDSQFVTVGTDGIILQSLDGVNWLKGNFSFKYGKDINCVTWNGSKFVIAGVEIIGSSPDQFPNFCYSSDNGTDWILQYPPPSWTLAITYGLNKFIIVGEYGSICTSNQ